MQILLYVLEDKVIKKEDQRSKNQNITYHIIIINCDRDAKTLRKSANFFVELRANFASPIFILHWLQISCG